MSVRTYFKLVLVFAVAFSLAILSGPLSTNFHLPSIQLGHAITPPGPCPGAAPLVSECWYPAGPEMSTEQISVFQGAIGEYVNLLSPNPIIDLTDSPVPAAIPISPGSQLAGPGYYLTAPVPETGYYEIQFMQANTFWNCPFQFGNSPCGVQIRQGIAHMIDKSAFATFDPNISPGNGIAIDNPVPTSSGGNLLSANSCGWDASFPETNTTGGPCTVGGGTAGSSVGGASYHLGPATGVASINCPWCQAPGSTDLNAAAQHFVNAGLATGFNPSTSILTGVISTSGITIPTFFIRNDDPIRSDLGTGLSEQICYLFTGAYTVPCPYLARVLGPIQQFQGFNTCTTTICATWWFYTAGYGDITFYDQSLYLTYNSRFVSGIPSIQPPNGPCSPQAVPTASASNYMYICNPNYDSLSTQLETSPCLSAQGDPVTGATSNLPTLPGNGICPGTATLSSHSTGVQAEDYFGRNVFTLPVYELKVQYGYLQCQPPGPCTTNNTWVRAINGAGVGLPNYFTWLNAYNPGPALPGTIRQGFAQTTHSVNPYLASSPQDLYIVDNVYDSLFRGNPLSTSQYLEWMTQAALLESSVTYNNGLSLPASTCTQATGCTFRFTLRQDLTWQDGTPVTAYDVAFSYLSMVATGAFLGTGASTMSGITILNPRQFDISVSSNGPFENDTITGIPIVPGSWWTNAGHSAWANAVTSTMNTCSIPINPCPNIQFTLSGSSIACTGACASFGGSVANAENLMTVNPADSAASYDPIANHTLVGSGPWECGVVTSAGSGTCTPTGSGNGQSSYALSAYTSYFRSSTRAATWIWAEATDGPNAVLSAGQVGPCFNQPVNLAGSCGHWQQGVGNPGSGTIVSISTVSIVDFGLYGVNWVAPFAWGTKPPAGIGAFPPILYALQSFDGSTTLTPAPGPAYSPIGCTVPNTFYNC